MNKVDKYFLFFFVKVLTVIFNQFNASLSLQNKCVYEIIEQV